MHKYFMLVLSYMYLFILFSKMVCCYVGVSVQKVNRKKILSSFILSAAFDSSEI